MERVLLAGGFVKLHQAVMFSLLFELHPARGIFTEGGAR
jgi:hypothetical protein